MPLFPLLYPQPNRAAAPVEPAVEPEEPIPQVTLADLLKEASTRVTAGHELPLPAAVTQRAVRLAEQQASAKGPTAAPAPASPALESQGSLSATVSSKTADLLKPSETVSSSPEDAALLDLGKNMLLGPALELSLLAQSDAALSVNKWSMRRMDNIHGAEPLSYPLPGAARIVLPGGETVEPKAGMEAWPALKFRCRLPKSTVLANITGLCRLEADGQWRTDGISDFVLDREGGWFTFSTLSFCTVSLYGVSALVFFLMARGIGVQLADMGGWLYLVQFSSLSIFLLTAAPMTAEKWSLCLARLDDGAAGPHAHRLSAGKWATEKCKPKKQRK